MTYSAAAAAKEKLQKCSVILLKGNDAFSDNYLGNCALQVLQT